MDAYGNITEAAKSLKISNKTLYRWADKDEELKRAIQEGRDSMLDFAENALKNKIEKGDTTAIIFFLKTQGRKRGYTEKKELDVNQKGDKPFTIILNGGNTNEKAE